MNETQVITSILSAYPGGLTGIMVTFILLVGMMLFYGWKMYQMTAEVNRSTITQFREISEECHEESKRQQELFVTTLEKMEDRFERALERIERMINIKAA